MAVTFGKLEYQITVPTGGWDTTVGGATKTIPAGTYYLSSPGSGARDFLDEVAFQFGASSVTGSLGENGTGLVTIQFSGSTAIAWVDTEVRDILGFTGDSASATSHTGTKHARGTWLSRTPSLRLNTGGNWRGHRESDYRSTSNMAGYVWVRSGQSRIVLQTLVWSGLKQDKVWIANETSGSGYANQSLERFWLDGVWGQAGWGTPGGPLRFYENAALDTNFGTYRVSDSREFLPEQMSEGLIHLWRWRMPKLIMVPGSDATGLGGTARAALTFISRETSSSTSNTTSYNTGSFTPNPDKAQYIGIYSSAGGTAEAPSSVVGCGLTWVLVTSTSFPAATRHLSVFRAMGSAPSAGALTITFANTMSSCAWSWIEVTNADTGGTNGSGATVQATTNTAAAASTSINGTLAALENAANGHLAFAALSTSATVTPDADFVELGDVAVLTPDGTLESESALNQTVCTATFASAAAAIVSVEVKAAVA